MICTRHHQAINELATELGLPANTIGFTLTVKANEPVTITAVYCADVSNICTITETVKKYLLVEKDSLHKS